MDPFPRLNTAVGGFIFPNSTHRETIKLCRWNELEKGEKKPPTACVGLSRPSFWFAPRFELTPLGVPNAEALAQIKCCEEKEVTQQWAPISAKTWE